MLLPGFSVTAPWAFIWFLDGNENKVVISIVGTNGKYFLINAHGVLRRMGAATEIPGMFTQCYEQFWYKPKPHDFENLILNQCSLNDRKWLNLFSVRENAWVSKSSTRLKACS